MAGPDKELTFPVESVTLDGSKSQDDQGIVFYHWENIRYPEILLIYSKIENKVKVIGARASCAVVLHDALFENCLEALPTQVVIG